MFSLKKRMACSGSRYTLADELEAPPWPQYTVRDKVPCCRGVTDEPVVDSVIRLSCVLGRAIIGKRFGPLALFSHL